MREQRGESDKTSLLQTFPQEFTTEMLGTVGFIHLPAGAVGEEAEDVGVGVLAEGKMLKGISRWVEVKRKAVLRNGPFLAQ